MKNEKWGSYLKNIGLLVCSVTKLYFSGTKNFKDSKYDLQVNLIIKNLNFNIFII